MKQPSLLTVSDSAEKLYPENLWPETLRLETFHSEKFRPEKLCSESLGLIAEPSLVAMPSFSHRSRIRATAIAPRRMPPSPPPLTEIALASPPANIITIPANTCITADVTENVLKLLVG